MAENVLQFPDQKERVIRDILKRAARFFSMNGYPDEIIEIVTRRMEKRAQKYEFRPFRHELSITLTGDPEADQVQVKEALGQAYQECESYVKENITALLMDLLLLEAFLGIAEHRGFFTYGEDGFED